MANKDQDLLWKQYTTHVDLYKHYLELVLKFNAFYYAATGAFLSFYLTRTRIGLLRWSLVFMALMSFGMVIFLVYGALRNRNSRRDVIEICAALGLSRWPELNVLTSLLCLSASLVFLVLVGFVALFVVGEQIR